MILEKTAMLITLNIACWSGSTTDKPASDEVTLNNNADRDVARVYKRLFPKEALKQLKKTANEIRDYHYKNTLPWPTRGVRLLTNASHPEYREKMEAYRDTLRDLKIEFIRNYDENVTSARHELGDLFRESDYPDSDALHDKFDLSWRIENVPSDKNFVADLAEDEIQLIRREMRERIEQDIAAAHHDIYDRIDKAITTLSEKLVDNSDGTAPIFRDTLIGNIRDLVSVIPKLNIFRDANLAKLCSDIQDRIANVDPNALRPKSPSFDPTERTRVRNEANNIRERLAGIYPIPEQRQAA